MMMKWLRMVTVPCPLLLGLLSTFTMNLLPSLYHPPRWSVPAPPRPSSYLRPPSPPRALRNTLSFLRNTLSDSPLPPKYYVILVQPLTCTEQSKNCSPLPAKAITSVYGGAIKKQKSFQKHSKSAEMFEKSNILWGVLFPAYLTATSWNWSPSHEPPFVNPKNIWNKVDFSYWC